MALDLGMLGQLATRILGAKYGAQVKAHDYKEELARKRADQVMRQRELEAKIAAQEQDAAQAAWKPYSDVLYGPNGDAILNRMAEAGTVHNFFDDAEEAAKAAGVKFDKRVWQVQAPTAPQQAQPATLPGTPEVVAEQMLPPGFGGMVPQPPQPVAQFAPGPSQDEQYRERYQPALKTRLVQEKNKVQAELAKLRGATEAARERLLTGQATTEEVTRQARLEKLQGEAAEAALRDDHLTALTKLAEANTLLTGSRREFIEGPQTEYTRAGAAFLGQKPTLIREGHAVTVRGQNLQAQTARMFDATRNRIANMDDATKNRWAQRLDERMRTTSDPARLMVLRSMLDAARGTLNVAGIEMPMDPSQVNAMQDEIRSVEQEFGLGGPPPGMPQFGRGGGQPAPTQGGGGGIRWKAPKVSLPAGVSETDISAVVRSIDGGTFAQTMSQLGQNDPLRAAAKRIHLRYTGQEWKGR